jgi:hypothetical protein
MNHLLEQVQQHGIALCQDLENMGLWIGSTLIFFTASTNLSILPMKGAEQAVDWQICTDLQFSPLGNTAASLWRCQFDVKGIDYKWQVRVHQIKFNEVSTTATIALESNPRALAFHPSENILSVSSIGELQIFQISSDGSTQLLHKLTSDDLRGSFEVHKVPNGPASPPSTELTAMAPHMMSEYPTQSNGDINADGMKMETISIFNIHAAASFYSTRAGTDLSIQRMSGLTRGESISFTAFMQKRLILGHTFLPSTLVS